VLVGLCFLSVASGNVLAIVQHYRDLDVFWVTLQRLLSYQGFVLLPILGIGPFILPRLFGLQSQHDFPEMRIPAAAWWRKAALAFGAGVLIIASFFLEAAAGGSSSARVCLGTTLVIALPSRSAVNALGVSVHRARWHRRWLSRSSPPGYRVGLLHPTFLPRFCVITFVARLASCHSEISRRKDAIAGCRLASGRCCLAWLSHDHGDDSFKVLVSRCIYARCFDGWRLALGSLVPP
jgi:hypothetical protein